MSLTQSEWYIHPTTGIDANNGVTPVTPLKTFAELSRRWGKGNLLSRPGANAGTAVNITVHILDSLPDSDPLNFDVILDGNVDLLFVGDEVASSTPFTVSTITSKNRDTNTPWQFTTGGGLTVGKRIYNSSQKAYMWPFLELPPTGSNLFRISEPFTMPDTASPYSLKPGKSPLGNRVTPLPNDNFLIQTLRNVKLGSMRVGSVRSSAPPSPRNKLVFKDLNIKGDISPELDMGTQFYCIGCSITGSIQLATGFDRNFLNCCQLPGQTIRPISGLTRFQGGAYISAGGINPLGSQGFLLTNCTTQLDLDVIFQYHSISIVAGNTLVIGTAGIFDSVPGGNGFTNSAGHGIMVSGGSVTCRKLVDDNPQLWGSGQKGGGVCVSSGGRFLYVTSRPTNLSDETKTPPDTYLAKVPTITGSAPGSNDFILGGDLSTYRPRSNGTFSGPYVNSWSNLSSTTKFGGNAVNPKADARILQTE